MTALVLESQHILMRTEMHLPSDTDFEALAAHLRHIRHTGDVVAHFCDGRVQSVTVVKENRVFAKIVLDSPPANPVG